MSGQSEGFMRVSPGGGGVEPDPGSVLGQIFGCRWDAFEAFPAWEDQRRVAGCCLWQFDSLKYFSCANYSPGNCRLQKALKAAQETTSGLALWWFSSSRQAELLPPPVMSQTVFISGSSADGPRRRHRLTSLTASQLWLSQTSGDILTTFCRRFSKCQFYYLDSFFFSKWMFTPFTCKFVSVCVFSFLNLRCI